MDVNALVKKVTGGAQGAHGTLSTVIGMMGGQGPDLRKGRSAWC